MENKIYIINFWYSVNYGANLTAYALYKLLLEFNKNTFLLNNIKSKDKYLINKFYVGAFIKKYFKIDKYSNEGNSILITGSDQVFNPKCEPIYQSDKMLDFGKYNDKKIAMSASFGTDKETFIKENSIEAINNLKSSLNTFDFISVREKSGVEICKDLFGTNAELIIDPVFILKKDKWDELMNSASENIKKQLVNNKIVSYVLDTNSKHKRAYKYLSKKYKTGVVELGDYKNSPENWLYAIKNCELFITNSFHGVCFAIIFQKHFICLSKETGKSTRFESLFNLLGINNQSVTLKDVYEKDCIFKIDYENINKKIATEQQKGLLFLKNAIETPKENTPKNIKARIELLENRIWELERKNNLYYQLKDYIWEKWLIIYHCYLPKFITSVVRFFWQKIRSKQCM